MVAEIMDRLKDIGARVRVAGGQIKIKGARLPEDLRAEISKHKVELLEHLAGAPACPVTGTPCEHHERHEVEWYSGGTRVFDLCSRFEGRSVNAATIKRCPYKKQAPSLPVSTHVNEG